VYPHFGSWEGIGENNHEKARLLSLCGTPREKWTLTYLNHLTNEIDDVCSG
jgi:hypothetical protein